MDRETGVSTLILSFLVLSCGGSTPSTSLAISWAANHEKAVNASGGGYRVYYSSSPGVNTTTAAFKDIPYVSGASTPTTATLLSPAAGTYYFRVVAYTTFLPPVGRSIRTSSDSTEVSIKFP